MQVSVIIVNYNTQHLTSSCIRSVIEKTKSVTYEIIVVDNGSTLFDPEIFKQEFPSIVLLKNLHNSGFAGGNNVGVRHAKGEYVLLLNSDTELMNDAVSIAVEKMTSDPKIGVLSGQVRYPDGRIQAITGRFPSITNECYELFRLAKIESTAHKAQRLQGDLLDYTQPAETDWIWGTFFMFPKKILQLFPEQQLQEDFFMYYEDVLWCFYIKNRLGLKIVYDPQPLIMHHLSGSSQQTDLMHTFITKSLPNQYLFLKKYYSAWYSKLYFFVKGLHLITLRKHQDRELAKVYFSYMFNSVNAKKTLNEV